MLEFAVLIDPSLKGNGPAAGRRASLMCERLRYRGPDDDGAWPDDSVGFAVAYQLWTILMFQAWFRQNLLPAA